MKQFCFQIDTSFAHSFMIFLEILWPRFLTPDALSIHKLLHLHFLNRLLFPLIQVVRPDYWARITISLMSGNVIVRVRSVTMPAQYLSFRALAAMRSEVIFGKLTKAILAGLHFNRPHELFILNLAEGFMLREHKVVDHFKAVHAHGKRQFLIHSLFNKSKYQFLILLLFLAQSKGWIARLRLKNWCSREVFIELISLHSYTSQYDIMMLQNAREKYKRAYRSRDNYTILAFTIISSRSSFGVDRKAVLNFKVLFCRILVGLNQSYICYSIHHFNFILR